jgi:tRNA (guanine-N7-)-methyltransferase
MEKRNLNNLLFLKAEAKEFLSLIPESISIHNTYMMFPDPWPKFKHHKRRLIQESFLSLLASKTLPTGKFFFRTDFNAYFEWTAQHLSESPDWTLVSDTLPYEHSSYFQDLLPEFQSLSASRHISSFKGV